MSTGFRVSASAHSPEHSFFRDTARQNAHDHVFLRNAIVFLDRVLRRALGIYEFSTNPGCLLRIAVGRVRNGTTLPDGACLHPSDTLIDLHFWNEHFEPLLAGKAHCSRARLICRHLELSMSLLAAYLIEHPEIGATMIHARVVMPLGHRVAKFRAIAEMYGFNVTISPVRGMARAHDFCEDFLVRALLWAFNPGPSKRRQLGLRRADLWIDRNTFVERYLNNSKRRNHWNLLRRGSLPVVENDS